MFKADGPGVVRKGDKVVAVKGKVRGREGWMAMRNIGHADVVLVTTAIDGLYAAASAEELARVLNELEGKA